MTLYAFRLDRLRSVLPRSRDSDTDVVTFSILINQQPRGSVGGIFGPMFAGTDLPAHNVSPTVRTGLTRGWTIGPFEIAPDDAVDVIFSGTNISDQDSEFRDEDEEKITLKILDIVMTTAAGSLGGVVGSLVTGALGLLTNPAATILGWEAPQKCNGLVFSDAVSFSGANLGALDYETQTATARESAIARGYTDAATHDAERCGRPANTDVTFPVLEVAPPLSVGALAERRMPDIFAKPGLMSLRPTSSAIAVKQLLGVLP